MMAKKAYVSPMAEQRELKSDVLLASPDNFLDDKGWDLTLLGIEEEDWK